MTLQSFTKLNDSYILYDNMSVLCGVSKINLIYVQSFLQSVESTFMLRGVSRGQSPLALDWQYL